MVGVSYANVTRGPGVSSERFEFSLVSANITAGGNLASPGAKSITLFRCPLGVNGSDTDHYLRISGGTGTAETVLITGGTCVSGELGGTLTFTTANAHTGNWEITSATAGIQEAINALPSTGGCVVLPAGTLTPYKGFTVDGKSGVTIEGQGVKATRLDITSMGSGHVAKFTSGSANWLRELTIGGLGTSVGMTGSDYAIIFDDQNSSGVEHVSILETPNGIHVTDNDTVFGQYRLWFQYIDIGYLDGSGRTGIDIEAGADHFISHVAFGAMTTALAAIRIRASGGTTIQNIDSLTSGLLIDPDGVGAIVAWVFLNCAMFDTTTDEPFKIAPTDGAKVLGIVATNCWFASSATNVGVRMQATAPSLVEDVVLNACRIFNNSLHGIFLNGDGVSKITLTSNIIASNSALASGSYHGIWVEDASDLIISQNQIGQLSLPGFTQHGVGIFFDTGDTDNIIVKDNLITDVTVSPILGLGTITGLNRIIEDNSPSTFVQPTVASATTLDLTGEAYEHFNVTGSTPVTAISPAWYGRQIYLNKSDGGTVNFNTGGNIKTAKTLSAGQTLICVYDAGGWGIVGP